MKKLNKVMLSIIVLALATGAALAVEAPQLINYQGVLRDASGAPQSWRCTARGTGSTSGSTTSTSRPAHA